MDALLTATEGLTLTETNVLVDFVLHALSFLRHWLRRILQKVEGFTLALYKHKSKLEGELFRELDKAYRKQKALGSAYPTTPQKSQCSRVPYCPHQPSCAGRWRAG